MTDVFKVAVTELQSYLFCDAEGYFWLNSRRHQVVRQISPVGKRHEYFEPVGTKLMVITAFIPAIGDRALHLNRVAKPLHKLGVPLQSCVLFGDSWMDGFFFNAKFHRVEMDGFHNSLL